MKRIIVSILIALMLIVGLIVLTGCGNNKTEGQTESNTSSNNNSNKSVTNEFSIGDKTLKFDKETTFKNFNYKNAEELEPDESQQAVYLDYENKDIYDGRFVFRISLLYSDETTLKEFLQGNKTVSKKINGINWSTLTLNNTADNKDTTSVVYATEKDGVVYIGMVQIFNESNVDAEALAEVFMNGVTIK